MKRINWFVLLLLLSAHLLQAQNYTISVKSNFNPHRTENWNVSLQLNGTQNVKNGLALSFPSNTHFVPVQILSGEKSFWLKNSESVPDSQNVIHWTRVDSLLILRFAPGITLLGGTLTIQLNLNNPRPGQDRGLLKWLSLQQNGQPGTVLSQAEIQFQQSVTR